jgi:hypothetical protein
VACFARLDLLIVRLFLARGPRRVVVVSMPVRRIIGGGRRVIAQRSTHYEYTASSQGRQRDDPRQAEWV